MLGNTVRVLPVSREMDMVNAFRLATVLYDMAIHAEDGTVSAHDEPLPKSGYYVGGKVESLVFQEAGSVDRGELAWWIGSNPARFYGVWVDSEDGKIYFDAVTHMNTRQHAANLGRTRGEIAIWDISAGEEIRVSELPF